MEKVEEDAIPQLISSLQYELVEGLVDDDRHPVQLEILLQHVAIHASQQLIRCPFSPLSHEGLQQLREAFQESEVLALAFLEKPGVVTPSSQRLGVAPQLGDAPLPSSKVIHVVGAAQPHLNVYFLPSCVEYQPYAAGLLEYDVHQEFYVTRPLKPQQEINGEDVQV